MNRALHFITFWKEQFILLFSSLGVLALLYAFFDLNFLEHHLTSHIILETLTITISFMVFYLGWMTYDHNQPGNILFISIIFLSIGLIELAHMLSYTGMPDFVTPSNPHKAISFWQIAGLLCAVVLILFTLVDIRPIKKVSTRNGLLFLSIIVTILIYWIVLKFEDKLPLTYIIGEGLTPFKIVIEYSILSLHFINLCLIVRRKHIHTNRNSRFNSKHMVSALTLLVVSELAFTLYANVSDIMNFTGHMLRILSFVYIFRAIFHENVHQPTLRLIHTEQQLRESNMRTSRILDHALEAVLIIDDNGQIEYMNQKAESCTEWDFNKAKGKPLEAVFRVDNMNSLHTEIESITSLKEISSFRSKLTKRQGTIIEIECSVTVITNSTNVRSIVFTFRDITHLILGEKQKDRLLATLEAAKDFVSIADIDRNIIYYNKAAKEILEIPEQEDYQNLNIRHHTEEAQRVLILEALPEARRNGTWTGESILQSQSGRQIPVSQIIISHKNPAGEVEYYSTIMRDITEWKIAEERNLLAMKVSDSIQEGIMVTDNTKKIVFINNAFTQLTGYSSQDTIGQTPQLLSSSWHSRDFYEAMWSAIRATGIWRGEIWNKKKDGTIYLEELAITHILDVKGEITHYVGIFTDITIRKELEAKIHHQAYHDILTGLPNRRLLQDRINQAILYAEDKKNILGIMYVDLDRFKRINDHLGHHIGDKLLQVFSERLNRSFRASDTISRVGGDEIIILLPDLQHRDDCIHLAEKVREEISKPCYIEGNELFMTCSIGISIYPEDSTDVSSLLKFADSALYKAKNMGRNNYQFYVGADRTLNNYSLERSLREALRNNEFTIHYQPIIRTMNQSLVGVEALIRWNHSERGLISPADFIPVAEETGQIILIDRWVLHQACITMKRWHNSGHQHLRVSVNLSMLQFQQPDLVENIKHILDDSGLPPSSLILEITERTMMNDPDSSILTMKNLSSLGVNISLDDFGIGYSSFNYLKQFPINILKIDKSFIKDITEENKDLSIVNSLIMMSHNLGLHVVAEGVEIEQQYHLLQQGNCDFIQGYFFNKPMSEEVFAATYLNHK